ncbi:hypothetical protein RRG08_013194 [Elysia crispata]|uniref:Uncharacterized protein n=1 Tax=Elysia crispata TaxID=231223 RepID=A0AAE1B3U9_9GAST|nr:hypothetical protein RRG08_013194 [Elysia crispata]
MDNPSNSSIGLDFDPIAIQRVRVARLTRIPPWHLHSARNGRSLTLTPDSLYNVSIEGRRMSRGPAGFIDVDGSVTLRVAVFAFAVGQSCRSPQSVCYCLHNYRGLNLVEPSRQHLLLQYSRHDASKSKDVLRMAALHLGK